MYLYFLSTTTLHIKHTHMPNIHIYFIHYTYTYITYTAIWLTLLARARKHTHTYPWASLKQVLLGKARDLLKLPTGEGVTGVYGVYICSGVCIVCVYVRMKQRSDKLR